MTPAEQATTKPHHADTSCVCSLHCEQCGEVHSSSSLLLISLGRMASDTSTLKAACIALYSPTSSERERAEANQWLITFASTPAAWESARALLTEPEEHVQYFGANVLFMKVRAEWHGLADDAKNSIFSVLRELVGQLRGAAGAPWTGLTSAGRRLCLVLAAAAVRSSTVETFANEALAMGADPAAAAVALELLVALPQELQERNQVTAGGGGGAAASQAPASVPELRHMPSYELRSLIPQVVSLLVATLAKAGPVDSPAGADCTASCLRCCKEWFSLQMGCSLVAMLDTAPSLITTALSALTSASDSLSDLAADALVELLQPANTQLPAGNEKAALVVHQLAEQLQQMAVALQIPDALSSGGELSERQFNLCRVLCAFAERAADIIAQTDGRLLGFVQLIFCLLGGELRAAELSIDFWTMLQDTPLAQRHEQLRVPLYRELQTKVMQRCLLPSSFTSWDDEAELDEDEFERFREQSAQEVLAVCLQLLHAEFIGAIRQLLTPAGGGSPSWQAFELAFFVTRCLHTELKATLSSDTDASVLPPPLLAAHKEAVKGLLVQLLAPAADSGAAFNGQPAPLLTSAVRLYGSFGKWLAREQQPVLEGVVRCVLQALVVEESGEHAAVAFRALCVHAQKYLGKADVISALTGICEPALRNNALSSELRVALMDGLARLVGSLTREELAQAALSTLVAPVCQLLQATLAQLPAPTQPPSKLPKEVVEQTATQLALVSSSFRFCDRYEPSRHPVLPVLQGCWPLLMEVAMRCRGEPIAVQAMCEVYSRTMGTLQALSRPLLPQALQHLASSFQTTPVVGCLTTLRDAIERFGRDGDAELVEMLSQVLTVIIQHTCDWLKTTAEPEAEPELLTAFWEMCHRCLIFRPSLLLSLPCASQLFDAAIGCVRHQQFTSTRAVLTFISLFMNPTDSRQPIEPKLIDATASCLQAQGARLLCECLSGLASTSPDNLVDHQVELMRVLIEACPSAVSTWLQALLANPQGVSTGLVDPQGDAMRTFAHLVLQQPALPQTDFHSVASDFSRICRGKLGAEALARYAHLLPRGPAA